MSEYPELDVHLPPELRHDATVTATLRSGAQRQGQVISTEIVVSPDGVINVLGVRLLCNGQALFVPYHAIELLELAPSAPGGSPLDDL